MKFRIRDPKQEKTGTYRKAVIWVLNLSIILAIVFLARTLGRRYFSNAAGAGNLASVEYLRVGSKFPLLKVDWGRMDQTVVVVLQTKCDFCEESAPFYKHLGSALSARKDIGMIAVMPSSATDAAEYLKQLGIPISGLQQISLQSLKPFGLIGTPTLVLVDRSGLVTSLWTGKLLPQDESVILGKLRIDPAAIADSVESRSVTESIDEVELQRSIETGRQLVVLDLRERESYVQNQFPNSRNIPIDELSVRARDELSPSDLIVLTGASSKDLTETANTILKSNGFSKIVALQRRSLNQAPAPRP